MNLYRINLKTDAKERKELINFCLLNPEIQSIAIGWSCVYPNDGKVFSSYEEYYDNVKNYRQKQGKRMNAALNIFYDTNENDLFWTRDLNGYYWICRAKGGPLPMLNWDLDIGAIVPVEAYLSGIEVPGGIKATFTRANAGIAQKIDDQNLLNYSKYEYNRLSKTATFEVAAIENESIIYNLQDFELEELVIAYIQIKYDYYVLSNSIASRSTTPGIECIFHSRRKGISDKAVVQVKGGKSSRLCAETFKSYLDEGYKVFLYAHYCSNESQLPNVVCIKGQELIDFYNCYKVNLPKSITRWEHLFLSVE